MSQSAPIANAVAYAVGSKIKHPWTNGQVERMNRTIKEATVKRYHYDRHEQLKTHLSDFINATMPAGSKLSRV